MHFSNSSTLGEGEPIVKEMVSLEAVCWPLGASAIVPEEFNCLLNPFHEDFRFEWFSGPELLIPAC
jgi:hypothetical protein